MSSGYLPGSSGCLLGHSTAAKSRAKKTLFFCFLFWALPGASGRFRALLGASGLYLQVCERFSFSPARGVLKLQLFCSSDCNLRSGGSGGFCRCVFFFASSLINKHLPGIFRASSGHLAGIFRALKSIAFLLKRVDS